MKPLVSLDVFDTAIFRKVYRPTDIFHVVEETVGNNFYIKRVEAQNKAGRENAYYNILDIYKYLPEFDLKEEILAEYSNCEANPYILDMYNNGGADYIFISDMYLPEKVIAGMLERCGYKNPQVFVSCDYKGCKGDGKLFKVVEEILGRKISKHIGDNYSCDIEGAKKAKVPEQEFVGPAIYNRDVITPELENKRLRKLLIDEELSDHDIAEKIGYLYAPLVYAFTKSVLNEARDDQTIFFNARDSFLMYVTARWILKTKKNIKYCRFSRKSCFLPAIDINRSIDSDDNKIIFDFLRTQRCRSIRDFLRTYKLDEDKSYSEITDSFHINMDTNIEYNPKRNTIIEQVVRKVQSDLYKEAKKQKEGFLKYISRLGVKSNDYFVDLGYNGSMQAMIKRISGIELEGTYICTFNSSQEYKGIKIKKKSFLDIGFFGFYGGIIELMFSEIVGTVLSYYDGKPDTSYDTKFRKEVIKDLLKGTFKGIKDLIRENISPAKSDCQKVIIRFLKQPTLEESSFANCDLFENGSFEKNENITNFDETLIRAGKIKECYNRSYWKDAFRVLLNNSSKYKSLERFIK